MIERRPRAPVRRRIAFLEIAEQRLFLKAQLDALHLEHALILLGERVLRAREDFDEGGFGEIGQRGQNRQSGR